MLASGLAVLFVGFTVLSSGLAVLFVGLSLLSAESASSSNSLIVVPELVEGRQAPPLVVRGVRPV